jgi:hypothetical protein
MPSTKDFDADKISVILNGERVADLDAVGFDQNKDHERDETVGDDGNVWIISTGEYSGTIAVKATSPSIPTLQEIYDNDESFTLAIKYAPVEPYSESNFMDAKLMSFAPSDDYDGENMPMWEGEFEADRAEHQED